MGVPTDSAQVSYVNPLRLIHVVAGLSYKRHPDWLALSNHQRGDMEGIYVYK